MAAAVARLQGAVANREPILVCGDYDVDGVTATALLTQVLRRYGGEVIRYIPNRFDEGYGLNTEALTGLMDSGVKLVPNFSEFGQFFFVGNCRFFGIINGPVRSYAGIGESRTHGFRFGAHNNDESKIIFQEAV